MKSTQLLEVKPAQGKHRRTPGLTTFLLPNHKKELFEAIDLAEKQLHRLAEKMQDAKIDPKHNLSADFFHKYIAGQNKGLLEFKERLVVMDEISEAQNKVFKQIAEAYLTSGWEHERLLDRIAILAPKASVPPALKAVK